jgi:hypothetical protein
MTAMPARQRRSVLAGALAVVAAIAIPACGPGPITPARLQTAIQTTFANLVEIQVSRLGLPPMHAPDFAVTAMCQKPAGGTKTGAGDWICTLVWRDPDRRTFHDTYDLAVTTDGCYTASIEGESLGGPTLKALGGGVVRNLLYTFEGCFDTSAP